GTKTRDCSCNGVDHPDDHAVGHAELVTDFRSSTFAFVLRRSTSFLAPTLDARRRVGATSWLVVAFSPGGDGDRRSPEHLAPAGRNLWLLGIWLEHVLKKIPFHHRYKEFTDELTNAHVPELCLER